MLKLIAVVLFTLCAVAAISARELTPSEKRTIAAGVSKSLKDPGSAQFQWLPWPNKTKQDDVVTYCGTMNGKNSYGAYTGFRPYVAGVIVTKGKIVGAIKISAGPYDQDIQDATAEKLCSEGGYQLGAAR